MDNSVQMQAYVFFSTLYGGIIIGFVYDLYRIFRYFSKPNKIITLIEDLIFWVIVGLIAVFILIFSNWGEIRGYVFLGFISGALLYSKLLSRPVITILVHTFRFVVKIIKYIFRIITYPIRLLGNIFYKPYLKITKRIKKNFVVTKRIIKLPVRILRDIVKYTHTILQKK